MSVVPGSGEGRQSISDVLAGLLSAGSMLLSFIAIGFGLILQVEPRPARLAPVAIVVALVAARMSVRYQKLAFSAAVGGMVAWVVGLTLAVITHHPLI
jgi:hypothetical protein